MSSNLCDALATLVEATRSEKGLSLSVSWARHRLPPQGPRVVLDVPREVAPTLREAARLFRSITPRDEFELQGYVYKLERAPAAAAGRVMVDGIVDGRWRAVGIELGDAHYQLALGAHDQRQRISGTGELVREGKSFVLRNPRNLEIPGPEVEGAAQ